jgi:hypothetical protein
VARSGREIAAFSEARPKVIGAEISAIEKMRPLFPDENANAGDDRQDRQEKPRSQAGEADDADDDQVNCEQEHADVFGEVHEGMLRAAVA